MAGAFGHLFYSYSKLEERLFFEFIFISLSMPDYKNLTFFTYFKILKPWLTKVSFAQIGGGAILLLLLLVLLNPAPKVSAQDLECVEAQCSNLRVEVVRHGNVTQGCSGSANCGGSDNFSQITYTVYLRHSKTVAANDPLLPFELEYDMLDVEVSLRNNSNPQFSHIDVNNTSSCFQTGVGAKWQYNPTPGDGNKVIFIPTDQQVKISFANLAPGSQDCGTILPNNTGNVITFNYNPPPGLVDGCGQAGPPMIRCAYAELFTFVVNAYPGENVGINFDLKRYLPSFGSSECNMEFVSTGSNNGWNNIQVLNPNHYTGTANENILAQFGAQTLVGANKRSVPINLTNLGTTSVDISYLEFMLSALTSNISEPFEYTLVTPRVSSSGGGSGPLTKNLHYLVHNAGITLNPGATNTLGTIQFTTPELVNLGWAADFSFINSSAHPSKSRIKTTNICTSLNATTGHSTASGGGDANCIDPSIHFRIVGEGLDCSTSKVRVGLQTTSPPANIRLSKVEFELEFVWSTSGIAITGVNYPSWPGTNIDCSTIGCYVPSGSGPKACWQVLNGKTFNYCYETNDLNAPLFNLNDLDEMEILFNTPNNACIDSVKIKKLRITYVGSNYTACIPVMDLPAGFPLCGELATMLRGNILTENMVKVEEVSVALSEANSGISGGMSGCPTFSCTSPCSSTDLTDADGVYQFTCLACTTCNKVKVIPTKNSNPLNGVTTYDLVLISKHILGLELLNSPYKIIAADANKSGSVTTFDIVELRKLILGINPSFPNNTSWRFVDEGFVFPNANNPFQTEFPEGINCLSFPSSGNDFVAIKVGDVNNSALGNRPSERPFLGLSWPDMCRQSGDILTIPIQYSGSDPIEAIQFGLRFDQTTLQLIGPSVGDVENYLPGNFNLLRAVEGEIRTLWHPMTDTDEPIQPGSVLFHLNFKVLSGSTEVALPLWLDHQLLAGAAWKPDGEEYSLLQIPPAVLRDDPPVLAPFGLTATVQPNPTSGGVTLSVQTEKAGKCRLAVFDAFGQMLLMREFELREGRQDLPLPEVALLPAGVYSWKVYTPSLETQGQLIKQ